VVVKPLDTPAALWTSLSSKLKEKKKRKDNIRIKRCAALSEEIRSSFIFYLKSK
jgi:hypothetical protein